MQEVMSYPAWAHCLQTATTTAYLLCGRHTERLQQTNQGRLRAILLNGALVSVHMVT